MKSPLECDHEHFEAHVDVDRLTKGESGVIHAYSAGIRINCSQCGEAFRFHGAGLERGMLADRPCLSLDEKELCVPLRPASSDPDFGLGIPGFRIRMRTGG